jgi:hypothetical protein
MPASGASPAGASAGAASSAGGNPPSVAAARPPEHAATTASAQSAAGRLLDIPIPRCIPGECRTPARSTQGPLTVPSRDLARHDA